MTRDFEEYPYTLDEQRVADFIADFTKGDLSGGDDPIGFLITMSKSWIGTEPKKRLPEKDPETAVEILEYAAKIVGGERETTHGAKERSFTVIANLWTAYLAGRLAGAAAPVSAEDVGWLMCLLKIARAIQGSPNIDCAVDCAGYSAIAGELMVANLK